jgi:EmrB/QacA subfamily drug resistance transporter
MTESVKNTASLMMLLAICLPVMIACVDIMAISVAINNIMLDLDISVGNAQWLIGGYTIGTAAFFIVIGRLADLYGRKKILQLGVVLFGLSSTVAALAFSPMLLIICRCLQGLASAMMMTTVVSIIMHTFPVNVRSKTIAMWGASLGLGMALGPLMGGVVLHFLGWRWIFAVNIPICIFAYFLIRKYIDESKNELAPVKVNYFEALLLSTLCVDLMLFLSEVNNIGWNSLPVFIMLVVFVVTTTVFIVFEKRKLHPIVDLSIFSYNNFCAAVTAGAISYFCSYAWLFIFTVYLQDAFGFTPLLTGVMFTAYALAFAVNAQVVGLIVSRLGNKLIMQSGFVLMFISLLFMAKVSQETTIFQLIAMFIMFGFGVTAVNSPSLNAASTFVPKHKVGIASGIIFTVRWLGGSVGVALITLIFEEVSSKRYLKLIGSDVDSSSLHHYGKRLFDLPSDVHLHMALTAGLSVACIVLSLLALGGFFIATFFILPTFSGTTRG